MADVKKLAFAWGTRCYDEGLADETPRSYEIVYTSTVFFDLVTESRTAHRFREQLIAECKLYLDFPNQRWEIRAMPVIGLDRYITYDLVFLKIPTESTSRCAIL